MAEKISLLSIVESQQEKILSLMREDGSHWIWTGPFSSNKYKIPLFYSDATYSVRKLMWILKHRREPDFFVLQTCDRRDCVNPEHLVSNRDEMLREHFRRRVLILTDGSGCHIYTGRKNVHGYGSLPSIKKNGNVMAHRFSYEIYKGPIPLGMIVCHSCDNPPCVNPDHLWLGTCKDNNEDRAIKGRSCKNPKMSKGRDHYYAKLTENDVVEIRKRRMSGEDLLSIANSYGVRKQTVWGIVKRRAWKHVP